MINLSLMIEVVLRAPLQAQINSIRYLLILKSWTCAKDFTVMFFLLLLDDCSLLNFFLTEMLKMSTTGREDGTLCLL